VKLRFLGVIFGKDVVFWAKNRGRQVNLRGLGKTGKKNLVKNREKCAKSCKNKAKMRTF